MEELVPGSKTRSHGGTVVGRLVFLVPMLWALTGMAHGASISFSILFGRDTSVPRPVQAFAWHVIETRCAYQSYEREQRTFWAYDVRANRRGTDVVYSMSILSELPWKKSEPPATIEMTVVDDGRLRLAALTSSFVVCASPPGSRLRAIPAQLMFGSTTSFISRWVTSTAAITDDTYSTSFKILTLSLTRSVVPARPLAPARGRVQPGSLPLGGPDSALEEPGGQPNP